MGLNTGSHRVAHACLIHGGRTIRLQELCLEVSPPKGGRVGVYASARVGFKIVGMTPGQTGIRITLEHQGEAFEITDATIFDIDYPRTGQTHLHITGALRSVRC